MTNIQYITHVLDKMKNRKSSSWYICVLWI